MPDDADRIATDGSHRGVALHAGQSAARLRVVRRDIDTVHRLTDLDDLVLTAANPSHAPEARLYAAAKARAVLDGRVLARAYRPRAGVPTREYLAALVAGLDCVTWRHPTRFCSLLDIAPALAALRENADAG